MTTIRSLAALTAVTVLGACSSHKATSPAGSTLTYSQLPASFVESVNESVVSSVESSILDFTTPNTSSYGGVGADALHPAPIVMRGVPHTLFHPRSMIMHLPSVPRPALDPTGNCPEITPAVPTYNAQGLPTDTLTLTFTTANCTFDAYSSISGVIAFWDPTPDSAAMNYNLVISDFDTKFGNDSTTEEVVVNAVDSVRNADGSAGDYYAQGVTLTDAGTYHGQISDTLTSSIVYTYPSDDGLLQVDGSLYPGSVNVNASQSISIAEGSNSAGGVSGTFNFTITTPTALQIDPTCTTGETMIVSGVVDINYPGHTATVTFNGCNVAPTVTD